MTERSGWLGCQRISFAECGSTNDEAGRLARAGARHGTVVIADTQRAGRGRDGRAWSSPPGGLYLSAVIRPPLALAEVPPMTLAIGIAVCDTVRELGAAAALKWPNDVLVRGRKLAGVLLEAQSQATRLEAVVVGIGVNLVTSSALVATAGDPTALPFGADGRAQVPAIALDEAAGAETTRDDFAAALLAKVEYWVDHYIASGLDAIIPAWQRGWRPGSQRARRSAARHSSVESLGSITTVRCCCATTAAACIACAAATSKLCARRRDARARREVSRSRSPLLKTLVHASAWRLMLPTPLCIVARSMSWTAGRAARYAATLLVVAAVAPSIGCEKLDGRNRNRAGNRLFHDKQFVDAAAQYERALAEVDDPLIHYNLGLAYSKLLPARRRKADLARPRRLGRVLCDPRCATGLRPRLYQAARQELPRLR